MSDSAPVSGVLHLILAGCASYGLYKMSPAKHPLGFTACVIAVIHGAFGGYVNFLGDESDGPNGTKAATTQLIEFLPLPLISIELYMMSETNNIALGHGLFVVPLAFDYALSFFKEGGEETAAETLKHMTVLGNITSLLYLAVNEGNYLYGGMAVLAFLAKYGALLTDSLKEGTNEPVSTAFYSGFFVLAAEAVGAEAK